MFCPCYSPTSELRIDPADRKCHRRECFHQHYGEVVGAQKWAAAGAAPEAASKRKGKGEPKRKRNPETGSRGGGRERKPGVLRKKVRVPLDSDGIPIYTLTAGATRDVTNLQSEFHHRAFDVETSPHKPRQPILGVHSFKMREDDVFGLFPSKTTRGSTRKFFAQIGFRLCTTDGVTEFTFYVDCYKENGWKVHRGCGTTAPELFFYTPAS